MTPSDLPPEFIFLRSPTGVWVSVIISLALLLLTLVWARRPRDIERRKERALAVEAAALTALLVIAITVLAVKLGWWQGDFFTALPPLVLLSIYLPFTIAGYTLWLGIYRWLRGKTRYAFWIYAALVLLFIPVVFLVDPIQMQRGQFSMGGGYTILADALVGQVVLWSPVLFYEAISRETRGHGDGETRRQNRTRTSADKRGLE